MQMLATRAIYLRQNLIGEITMSKRFAVGAVLLVYAALAFADTADKETLSAANAMVERFVDSWNHADGVAYGKNYWPEAELVNPSGVIVTGKAAIVQEHVDLWGGIFKGSHIAGRVRRVQMLGANYMIVDFDLQLSGFAKAPPGAPPGATVLKNHIKHVMEKRDGVWKVLSAQNTLIAAN
jgi:uncharacterized protein (TIGR02246 family)